jgi:hypothetical protein
MPISWPGTIWVPLQAYFTHFLLKWSCMAFCIYPFCLSVHHSKFEIAEMYSCILVDTSFPTVPPIHYIYFSATNNMAARRTFWVGVALAPFNKVFWNVVMTCIWKASCFIDTKRRYLSASFLPTAKISPYKRTGWKLTSLCLDEINNRICSSY